MNTPAYANPYSLLAANAPADLRAAFMRRTYAHLGGAILAFAALTAILVNSPVAGLMLGIAGTKFGWLIVLGAFMGVSWLADSWARSDASVQMQYVGLGLYIAAQAVIFTPLLYIAAYYSSPDVIPTAGLLTLALFGGLTATAFITRADFSFLRSILAIGGFVALGVIAGSILFGFTLGLFFSAIMVVFAAGSVLYTTSNIIHHYRTDQHVAASLALFAAVALMFWYILQIFLSRR